MGEQEDRTFIITFIGVIAVLVGVTIALIILAASAGSPNTAQQEERLALQRERAEERLQPMGAVRLSGEPMPASEQQAEAGAEAGEKSGEQIVQSVCAACHGSGVMDAPKIGDTAAWEEVMEQGWDTVISHAIDGIGGMPPRGGDASLSDEEVEAAVTFMLEESDVAAE